MLKDGEMIGFVNAFPPEISESIISNMRIMFLGPREAEDLID